MLIKVADLGSWNFQEPTSQQVKLASGNRLAGSDLRSFLKRSSTQFADEIRGLELHPDEIPMHLIAIGSHEAWGSNRNGDAFKEAACRAYHDTFVKHAYNYKNHKNTDPKKSYGRIKASCYNEEMRRIELLMTFNSTKAAARFNDGLVAEDWVLQKLARDEDIPGSMACKVAYDVCLSCGHKARSRQEYCTEETCVGPSGEKRGGCRHNLTKLADDGHVNGVDNPHPRFFDYSHLSSIPADRTAYGGVARYMNKAATGEVMGGAALAEAWGLFNGPVLTEHGRVNERLKLAQQLATIETDIERNDRPHRTALVYAYQHATAGTQPAVYVKVAALLKSLAQAKNLLPLETFLVLQDKQAERQNVADRLPGVYTRIAEAIDAGAYELIYNTATLTESPSAKLAEWAQQQQHTTVNPALARERAIRGSLQSPEPQHVKRAHARVFDAQSEALAWEYALHNLAVLDHMTDVSDESLELAVLQNYVR